MPQGRFLLRAPRASAVRCWACSCCRWAVRVDVRAVRVQFLGQLVWVWLRVWPFNSHCYPATPFNQQRPPRHPQAAFEAHPEARPAVLRLCQQALGGVAGAAAGGGGAGAGAAGVGGGGVGGGLGGSGGDALQAALPAVLLLGNLVVTQQHLLYDHTHMLKVGRADSMRCRTGMCRIPYKHTCRACSRWAGLRLHGKTGGLHDRRYGWLRCYRWLNPLQSVVARTDLSRRAAGHATSPCTEDALLVVILNEHKSSRPHAFTTALYARIAQQPRTCPGK